MLGLGLAALYWLVLGLSGTVFEAGYYRATNFLFWWYCFWAILFPIFALLFVAIFGLISASVKKGIIGKINGRAAALVAGTALSISWLYTFHWICFAAGAYFLNAALVINGAEYAYSWNLYKLLLGVALWTAGWIISKK